MLHRYFGMHLERELKKVGVQTGQVIFMAELFTRDGITQDHLTAILHFDKATTAKALQKLEIAGFVERKEDQEDKRCKRIFLTKKSRQIEQSFFYTLDNLEDVSTVGFDRSEVELLGSYLKRMVRNMLIDNETAKALE